MDPFKRIDAQALPSIQSQLPYAFKRGTKLYDFDAYCSCCSKQIEHALVRGVLTPLSDRMLQVRALGFCRVCDKFSKFDYRVDDELAIVGRDTKGTWRRWIPKRAGWLSRNWVPMLFGIITFILLGYLYGFP